MCYALGAAGISYIIAVEGTGAGHVTGAYSSADTLFANVLGIATLHEGMGGGRCDHGAARGVHTYDPPPRMSVGHALPVGTRCGVGPQPPTAQPVRAVCDMLGNTGTEPCHSARAWGHMRGPVVWLGVVGGTMPATRHARWGMTASPRTKTSKG